MENWYGTFENISIPKISAGEALSPFFIEAVPALIKYL